MTIAIVAVVTATAGFAAVAPAAQGTDTQPTVWTSAGDLFVDAAPGSAMNVEATTGANGGFIWSATPLTLRNECVATTSTHADRPYAAYCSTAKNKVSVTGAAGADSIEAYAAGDVAVHAGGGNDTVTAGPSSVPTPSSVIRVYSEDGNDTIRITGDHASTVDGGLGDDYIVGGSGADGISGGAGNDLVGPSRGHDVVHGDAGTDWLVAGQDGVTLYGDDGNDLLGGGIGTDFIYGGAGNNTISSGKSLDLVSTKNGVRDTIDCGKNLDTHTDWLSIDSVDALTNC